MTRFPARGLPSLPCLQVLEHIPDPTAFARKLFECGQVVIVSVPYRWEAGACSEHIHDPVDERKLREWLGGDWAERTILDSRIVTVNTMLNDREDIAPCWYNIFASSTRFLRVQIDCRVCDLRKAGTRWDRTGEQNG